jgi:hypothetical protein
MREEGDGMSDDSRPAETVSSGPSLPHLDAAEQVTIPRYDLDVLLAVATMYVKAFSDNEMMTLPERMRLQEVEALVGHYGERY